MSQDSVEEPTRAKRVFGFFVFVAALGLAYSLTRPSADRRNALASTDDQALAYAACQAGVRDQSLPGATLRFPDAAESFGEDGGSKAVVSRVVVEPVSGSPFAQRFVCRVRRVGAGPASVWRVARLQMDMPVS